MNSRLSPPKNGFSSLPNSTQAVNLTGTSTPVQFNTVPSSPPGFSRAVNPTGCPNAAGLEIVSEGVDLLIPCNGIRRIQCAAVVAKDLLISVRTTENAEDACALPRVTIEHD
jgi:hypothetical protein